MRAFLIRTSYLGLSLSACVACSAEDATSPGLDGQYAAGEDDSGPSGGDASEGAAPGGAGRDEGGSGAGGGGGGPSGSDGDLGPDGGDGEIEPGTLTAGTWDDNLNFDFFSAYRNEMTDQQHPALPPFSAQDHQDALLGLAPAENAWLDVSLVVDTTGSMADELTYLQTEFDALAARIGNRYPNAAQRWSLIVYRDEGDEYVVRTYDFLEDTGEFRSKLAAQRADGGGDYPEAPDQALASATDLSWRNDGETARVLFWVADAPHHNGDASRFADAILAAQDKDIHIYPIASSGVDELTEFSMRSAAQLTGGRYLFLTDDSGVGGTHKEPTIPCYFVTKLDDAILRMIDIELSGEYRAPTEEEVIRASGDPENGICTLDDGEEVHAC